MIDYVNQNVFAKYTELKVIQPLELQDHINEGWLFLALYNCSTMEQAYMAMPWNVQNEYGNSTTADLVVPAVKSEVRFIMGRSGEAKNIQERLEELEHQSGQHQEVSNSLRNRVAELRTQLEQERNRSIETLNVTKELRSQNREMEVDIGKIERALGTERMRQILEGGNDG